MLSFKHKPVAIVFCRLSRPPSKTHGVMSLASQQFSINHFREKYEMGTHAVLQSVGSAFSKPQTDILNLMKSSKNKVVIVYEPNRLSRSVENFKKMWDICRKNKNKIAVVTLDRFFDPAFDSDYDVLLQLIVQAENESRDMGRRISRTMQYKKSREPAWGFMRDEKDEIVENQREQKINSLIKLLGTAESSIAEIRFLVEELAEAEGVEPFEIVEHEGDKTTDVKGRMPYGMDAANIRDTLKIYGIRHRRRSNWTTQEIIDIQNGRVQVSREAPIEERTQEWICVYYDPAVGLPPYIRIPPHMVLPTRACEIYIPK